MKSLAQNAVRFEAVLDQSRDEDGLVYSVLKADALRPWRNEDFEGKGYDLWDHWSGDFAGGENYEDAIMATGRYVDAKLLKRASHPADARALADAERSVRALLALSREGDAIESGYLPKPYGGLRFASKSRSISTDQYEHALFALWGFREACPDSPLVSEIESAIVRWCDYFIRHDFAFTYYGRIRVSVNDAVHMLGLLLPLAAITHRITGDPRYAEVLAQRLAPMIPQHLIIPTDSPAHLAHPNIVNLIVMGLAYCRRNGIRPEDCREAIGRWTRLGLRWLSKDRLAFCYAEGSDTDPVAPHYLEGASELGLRFLLWRSNVKGADSSKIAHTLMLAAEAFPEEGWRDRAVDLLGRFQVPAEFLHYYDPDGDQIPSEYGYLRQMLSLQHVGAWLQTWYMAGA